MAQVHDEFPTSLFLRQPAHDRLVAVWLGSSLSDRVSPSTLDFDLWREHDDVFERLAGIAQSSVRVTIDGESHDVNVARVQGDLGAGAVRGGTSRLLLAVEVGVALVVAAATLTRSFVNLVSLDPGFSADNVIVFRTTSPPPSPPAPGKGLQGIWNPAMAEQGRSVIEDLELVDGRAIRPAKRKACLLQRFS